MERWLPDATGLAAMDALFRSRGASGVLEVSRGEGPRAALAVVWARLRGVDLREAERRGSHEAGFCDALRFVRYAWTGGARAALGALLCPGDRRAARLVSRQWREFMGGEAWRREEEEAEAAVLRLFGMQGGCEAPSRRADAAAIAFSGGRGALLRGMGLRGVLEREAARRRAEAAWQGYEYDELIQVGGWLERGRGQQPAGRGDARVMVPRLTADLAHAAAAGMPWPY